MKKFKKIGMIAAAIVAMITLAASGYAVSVNTAGTGDVVIQPSSNSTAAASVVFATGAAKAVAFQVINTGNSTSVTNSATITVDASCDAVHWVTGFATIVVPCSGLATVNTITNNIAVGVIPYLRIGVIDNGANRDTNTVAVVFTAKPSP